MALATTVVLLHDIPGRLRFRLAPLRRDRRKAALLRARVRAIAGVRAVSANPLTGSLVVHHDDRAETRKNIFACLAGFGPGESVAQAKVAPASKLADILASAIAEHLIEQILRAAVAVVI